MNRHETVINDVLNSKDIGDFIRDLASIQSSNIFCNQYSFELEENAVRRNNLLIYLEQMKLQSTSVIFVGEAPGYKGACLTGLPFTSEEMLLNNDTYFGVTNGFDVTSQTLHKEGTANTFWKLMEEIGLYPLVWNAFPYHPFKVGDSDSNRAPLKSELDLGQEFLKRLIKMYKITKIIAVGKKPSMTLDKLGLKHYICRHPSYGGNNIFRRQILKIFT